MYDFYEIFKLGDLISGGLGPQLLVVAPNGEVRSNTAIEQLIQYYPPNMVLLLSEATTGVSDPFCRRLSAKLKTNGIKFEIVPSSGKDTNAATEGLLEKIISKSDAGFPPAIDMTGIERRFLFLLLKKLKERAFADRIDIIYTEPDDYAKELSIGAGIVSSFEGFGGLTRRGGESLLILQLGFEGQRALAVQRHYEDSRLIPVIAFPAFQPSWIERAIQENSRIVENFDYDISLKYSPANDPFQSENVIEEIRTRHPGSDISIAPLGSKPQSLGACLAAIYDPSIRIVDAPPISAMKPISQGHRDTWVYRIDLSKPAGPYDPH